MGYKYLVIGQDIYDQLPKWEKKLFTDESDRYGEWYIDRSGEEVSMGDFDFSGDDLFSDVTIMFDFAGCPDDVWSFDKINDVKIYSKMGGLDKTMKEYWFKRAEKIGKHEQVLYTGKQLKDCMDT